MSKKIGFKHEVLSNIIDGTPYTNTVAVKSTLRNMRGQKAGVRGSLEGRTCVYVCIYQTHFKYDRLAFFDAPFNTRKTSLSISISHFHGIAMREKNIYGNGGRRVQITTRSSIKRKLKKRVLDCGIGVYSEGDVLEIPLTFHQ